jgi:NADPH:quinone reductase-like Zn-dependent oxidoreductase
MKAIVSSKYGPPEVLRLQEVDMPVMSADGVLVRVLAASVNPLDWLSMRGEPLLMRPMTGFPRPKRTVPGVDVAGVVERVGANVTGMQPGDEVFGWCWGTFAEYVCGGEQDLAPKPEGLSFTEAAAVPLAAQTALQALRDHGKLQPGQRVLVNGAAGGVGTFAVQVAKALGAYVAGVCSTKNVEMVRSLGADEVVDYTAEDFTHKKQGYDLVLDTVGNRSLSRMRRALAPHGALVVVGAGGGRLLGPLSQMLRARLLSPFVGQSVVTFMAKQSRQDLLTLKQMIDEGKVRPVIERTYSLAEAAEAVRHVGAHHARGKVVLSL